MEILFLALPPKSKCRQPLVSRDVFNKCGESTNFSRSYSGVPFRNLAEIPRLTSEAKGQKSACLDEPLIMAFAERGAVQP